MKRLYRLFLVLRDLRSPDDLGRAASRPPCDPQHHAGALAAYQREIDQMAAYSKLDQLAGSVDGPPNEVFDDGQIEANASADGGLRRPI